MKILIALFLTLSLVSCADSKTFKTKDGRTIHAEPYGWANENVYKNEEVVYEACLGNVIWSIVGIETIIAPVWLTGWELFEPVKLKEPQ